MSKKIFGRPVATPYNPSKYGLPDETTIAAAVKKYMDENHVTGTTGADGNSIFYCTYDAKATESAQFQTSFVLNGDKELGVGDMFITPSGWLYKITEISNDVLTAVFLTIIAGKDGDPGERGYGIGISVKEYGAKGDGYTDDTTAFQNALAANRVVFVPGGTYKLSDTLLIRENCELQLSQDTVLNFTQTNKNCITMLRLASIRGNHATIFVPYTFNANVINCDTREDEAVLDQSNLASSNASAVPPFKKWDPQWKMSRYITDINICKPGDTGSASTSNEHESLTGDCYGTALYLGCHKQKGIVKFMWGVSVSGLRIAGGFTHGIHIFCTETANAEYWNHDMRIEAVIEACEIGVLVENTFFSRLAVTVQPRVANDGTVYAKHGFKLVNAKGTDLTSSRVWDWGAARSLWANGNEYQHIAMYGQCPGLILDDFLYYEDSINDIRSLIYTDTASNLEQMTILQEPITRWFKPVDGVPYFTDGTFEKQLMTQENLDIYFDTDYVKSFTDVLATATGIDGSIYNGKGYKNGVIVGASTDSETSSSYYTSTGFISCRPGDEIHVLGMNMKEDKEGSAKIVLFDSNKQFIQQCRRASLVAGTDVRCKYEETDNGCVFTIASSVATENTRFARLTFNNSCVGDAPMIAVNEEIKYTVEGFLADGVKVKGDSVMLYSPSGKIFRLTVSEEGVITAAPVSV